MDYTEGALDIPAQTFRDALMRNLGPMVPGNSQFEEKHLLDLIKDRRYYALKHDATVAVVEKWAEALPYIPEVCDCDTKTVQFGTDMARAARDCGWEFGLACAELVYLSLTLGKPHEKRLDGYHSAPIIAFQATPGEFGLLIVQPPTVKKDGEIVPAQYHWPATELRGWVVASSLT